MGQPVRLSVTVITLDEERNIGRCLESVEPVADEVVVVDSLSTDRTREICLARGATFVEQPFLGYTEQKNFALDRASFDHVLSLDADECLSEELRQRILELKTDWTADGFMMNRFNNYYGRWIRHSALYPDRKLRLWDRTKGRWAGGKVHEKVEMAPGAKVRRLRGDLLHYAYDTIDSHVHQANRFSSLAALGFFEEGRKSGLLQIVSRPTARFLQDFLLRRGFLDGIDGLTVCSINAYMTFLKYVKLRDRRRSGDRPI